MDGYGIFGDSKQEVLSAWVWRRKAPSIRFLTGATVGVGWGGILLRVACPKEVNVQSKVRQERERAFLILQI